MLVLLTAGSTGDPTPTIITLTSWLRKIALPRPSEALSQAVVRVLPVGVARWPSPEEVARGLGIADRGCFPTCGDAAATTGWMDRSGPRPCPDVGRTTFIGCLVSC